eukprot:3896978-Prymnesium_polylepis.1
MTEQTLQRVHTVQESAWRGARHFMSDYGWNVLAIERSRVPIETGSLCVAVLTTLADWHTAQP